MVASTFHRLPIVCIRPMNSFPASVLEKTSIFRAAVPNRPPFSPLFPAVGVSMMIEEGWAQLPSDILSMITEYLLSADRARFRSVCCAWSSAPSPMPPPMRPPWLLLPPSSLGYESSDGGGNKGTPKYEEECHQQHKAILYSIFDNKTLELSSGHLVDVIAECRAIVSYSLGGWLMYMDKICELQCVNLVTGERIHPPSITTIPDIKGVRTDDKGHTIGYYFKGFGVRDDNDFASCESMYWFYQRGIIISRDDLLPAQYINHSTRGAGEGYIIVVAHHMCKTLAFARQGDSSWTHGGRNHNDISSFILHKGFLYVTEACGIKNCYFDISSDIFFQKPIALSPDLSHPKQVDASTSYFVKVDEHLLLIRRYADLTEELITDAHVKEYPHMKNREAFWTPKTVSFQVYKFDESQTTWVEMDNIGGFAVFLGKNYSLALSIHDFPYLTRDCIYFTDDDEESYLRSTWWDLGVFNMLDKSVSTFCNPLIAKDLPQPTWIMPFPL